MFASYKEKLKWMQGQLELRHLDSMEIEVIDTSSKTLEEDLQDMLKV